jgi:hypothetical protein
VFRRVAKLLRAVPLAVEVGWARRQCVIRSVPRGAGDSDTAVPLRDIGPGPVVDPRVSADADREGSRSMLRGGHPLTARDARRRAARSHARRTFHPGC